MHSFKCFPKVFCQYIKLVSAIDLFLLCWAQYSQVGKDCQLTGNIDVSFPKNYPKGLEDGSDLNVKMMKFCRSSYIYLAIDADFTFEAKLNAWSSYYILAHTPPPHAISCITPMKYTPLVKS